MKNYEQKFKYLANRQNWLCPIGLKKYGRKDPVHDLHHRICHNTKLNRKKYPLFIDSMLNLQPVNHDNHLNNPSWGGVRNGERIAERWERFLERHPRLYFFVNGDFF